MNWNSKKRWLLAAALFLIFILCFFMDLTGVALHQWLGLAAGAASLYHLLVHADWVMAVSARFFGRTSNRARLSYIVDAALLAGFAAMVGTGILVSTWLDLASASGLVALHIGVSVASLVLVLVKIALHADWIVATSRKVFAAPAPRALTPADRGRAPLAPADPGRRAFLRVMGAVSVLAVGAVAASLPSLARAATALGEDSSSQVSQASSAAASASSSASSCRVECGRRCAYPGRCRRYVDSNGNGRCDLGECTA